jgi:hypothetical protein
MGKYFIHHYELAMVLTAILASRVIGSFFSSMPNPAIARAICLPVLLALVMRLYAVSMVPTFVSNVFAGKRVSPRDLHLARSEKPDDWELQCDQITDYLERQGVRGGAIEVWGWAPGLYWRTGTHPSSRFMMMIPLVMKGPYMRLRDYQLAWQREYLDSLRSDPPKFIVIAKDTMGLHTFYDQRADVLIDIIPGFRALLDSAYRLDTAMRIWDVYKKNRTRD